MASRARATTVALLIVVNCAHTLTAIIHSGFQEIAPCPAGCIGVTTTEAFYPQVSSLQIGRNEHSHVATKSSIATLAMASMRCHLQLHVFMA